jgi:hypothetical protein
MPGPLALRVRILLREGMRQVHAPTTIREILLVEFLKRTSTGSTIRSCAIT